MEVHPPFQMGGVQLHLLTSGNRGFVLGKKLYHYVFLEGTALLLNHDANVELSAEGNFTPLFESAKGGHLDCLKLLIRSGADVNVVAG